jgi:hypothetical protein
MIRVEIALGLMPIYCPSCGIIVYLEEQYKSQRERDHREIYCPNGHTFNFPAQTEEERLRKVLMQRERDLTDSQQELAKCRAKARKEARK